MLWSTLDIFAHFLGCCAMYEHVRSCRPSTTINLQLQYRKHNISQPAGKQVCADQSAITQASIQRASTAVPGVPLLQYRKHSTASTAESARTKPQSNYVLHRVQQRKQADGEHLMYCSTASTAQHSAISSHKAAKQLRADQSATTQASRQSWREPAHVVEHFYSTLSSPSERRN